jgi:hypothetical protein
MDTERNHVQDASWSAEHVHQGKRIFIINIRADITYQKSQLPINRLSI